MFLSSQQDAANIRNSRAAGGRDEPLTRAEIALRGFDRSATEQELGLLQFSLGSP